MLFENASGDLVVPPKHESRVLHAMRRQLFFERQRCARLSWPLYSLQRDGASILWILAFFYPIVALAVLVRPSWDEPWILRYELERRWRRWRRRRSALDASPYRAASGGSAIRPGVTHS